MATVKTERVLVVPTQLLHEIGHFQGFCADADRYLPRLLDPEATSYRPRTEMEEDPSFKQLIPYCIFRCGERVFQYTRGRSQGEARLHQLRSIGVGGHVSTDDRNLFDTSYEEALHRELAEEVHLESPYRERCIGLINDDETPVGRVHLGIVHLFDLDEPNVRPRERSLTRAGFEQLATLLEQLDDFETWSQICLRRIHQGVPLGDSDI